jgi:hypothetical protein
MILPSKHLPPSRALITIGADILSQLDEPRAISELWERVRAVPVSREGGRHHYLSTGSCSH